MKKKGRFKKIEILELEERFLDGQTLYKIGRDMQRSQASIRGHLMNLGLMEYEVENEINFEGNFTKSNVKTNLKDLFILSLLMIIVPSLGMIYMGLMILKD